MLMLHPRPTMSGFSNFIQPFKFILVCNSTECTKYCLRSKRDISVYYNEHKWYITKTTE